MFSLSAQSHASVSSRCTINQVSTASRQKQPRRAFSVRAEVRFLLRHNFVSRFSVFACA